MSKCNLTIKTLVDGEKVEGVVHSILPYGADYTPVEYVSDENGECVIELDYDTYVIQSEYQTGYTDNILTIELNEETYTLEIILKSEVLELDSIEDFEGSVDCDDGVLLDKTCKYFHHDPYMTPNNYDLYFPYNNIPVNIITESPSNLHKRLQRCLPLTKILHLNLETNDESKSNVLNVHSRVSLNYKTTKITVDNNLFYPTVSLEWEDILLNNLLSNQIYNTVKSSFTSLLTTLHLTREISDATFKGIVGKLMESIKEVESVHTISEFVEESQLIDENDEEEQEEQEEEQEELEEVQINESVRNNIVELLDIGMGELTNQEYILIGDDSIDGNDTELLLKGIEVVESTKQNFITTLHDSLYLLNINTFKTPVNVNVYGLNELLEEDIELSEDNNWSNTLTDGVPIYPTLTNGELDYTNKIPYSITHNLDNKIYTCTNCGKQYYTDTISECDCTLPEEVESYTFTEQNPYVISISSFTDDYLEDNTYKLL